MLLASCADYLTVGYISIHHYREIIKKGFILKSIFLSIILFGNLVTANNSSTLVFECEKGVGAFLSLHLYLYSNSGGFSGEITYNRYFFRRPTLFHKSDMGLMDLSVNTNECKLKVMSDKFTESEFKLTYDLNSNKGLLSSTEFNGEGEMRTCEFKDLQLKKYFLSQCFNQ